MDSSRKKLLVICGPTATGKTSLALSLAKKFDGELVSADSRQVYKEMDIGTGKDLPVNVKCQMSNVEFEDKNICFYDIKEVRIWAYDLVEATEEFSVSQYIKIAKKIVEDIWKRKKLPILVGGTGFYIKAVIEGIPRASVAKNKRLRKSLEKKEAAELFTILNKIDSARASLMNESDRKNPRRLIRAIEIAKYKLANPDTSINRFIEVQENEKKKKHDVLMNRFIATEDVDDGVLFIGLTAPRKILYEIIEKRVEKRLKDGIEKEIEKLLLNGIGWDDQAMQSLGYRQWRDYFEEHKSNSELKSRKTKKQKEDEVTEKRDVIQKWKQAEKRYAKRQITWFKKDKRINWFDITKSCYKKNVEKLVRKWHNA
jgi:tRNA dimethylallyltransferase